MTGSSRRMRKHARRVPSSEEQAAREGASQTRERGKRADGVKELPAVPDPRPSRWEGLQRPSLDPVVDRHVDEQRDEQNDDEESQAGERRVERSSPSGKEQQHGDRREQ